MTKINTLADQYAAAKAVLDAAEAAVKEIKEQLVALGQEAVEGKSCIVTVSLGQRNSLDANAVEAALGADWVKAHTKAGAVYEILRIKNKPSAKLVRTAIDALEDVA